MNRFEENSEPINEDNLLNGKSFSFKEAMGYVINVAFIVILTLALYAKVEGNFDINWRETCFELLFMYMVGIIVYINSLSLGKLSGQKRKEYVDAYKDYKAAVTTLNGNKYIENIDEFCLELQKTELTARKRVVLSSVHIPYDKYLNDYADKSIKELRALKKPCKDGEKKRPFFNKVQLRALINVMYMRPHKLNSQQLTKFGGAKTKGFIENDKKVERRKIFTKFVSFAVKVFICINFTVGIVTDFSYKTVVENLVRLIPILWCWISGQFEGYNLSVNNKVANFTDKARLCTLANKWLNEKYSEGVVLSNNKD